MGDKLRDITLEEVELSEDEKFWQVTLSGLKPVPPPPSALTSAQQLARILQPDEERIYKAFTIDAHTGSVKSMRIRKV